MSFFFFLNKILTDCQSHRLGFACFFFFYFPDISGLQHRESLMLTFPFFSLLMKLVLDAHPISGGDEERRRWRRASQGGGAYLSGSDRAGIGGLFLSLECLEQIKRFALFFRLSRRGGKTSSALSAVSAGALYLLQVIYFPDEITRVDPSQSAGRIYGDVTGGCVKAAQKGTMCVCVRIEMQLIH